MMEEAIARGAVQSGYYVGTVALAYYMQDDNSCAVEWIRRADLKQFSIYYFVAALIFARSGLERDAKASASAFMAMRPRFFDDFSREPSARNFNARDRAIRIKGARDAGFPVGLQTN
ncbi:hypothetical protein DK26_19280 [Bosea sp. WAO]|uniref:hypothetical protein n=1 Tax=Bosea sp. WAO TaxID=406341 RepID=UPI00074651F8|nr:hypothetical protein [Bosea sp. WAO]KUL93900.1 hypothetical protein DK26_19280 [Bosea sp. WAO]